MTNIIPIPSNSFALVDDADNHKVFPACHRTRYLWMTKGVEDDMSLYASTGSFAPG